MYLLDSAAWQDISYLVLHWKSQCDTPSFWRSGGKAVEHCQRIALNEHNWLLERIKMSAREWIHAFATIFRVGGRN